MTVFKHELTLESSSSSSNSSDSSSSTKCDSSTAQSDSLLSCTSSSSSSSTECGKCDSSSSSSSSCDKCESSSSSSSSCDKCESSSSSSSSCDTSFSSTECTVLSGSSSTSCSLSSGASCETSFDKLMCNSTETVSLSASSAPPCPDSSNHCTGASSSCSNHGYDKCFNIYWARTNGHPWKSSQNCPDSIWVSEADHDSNGPVLHVYVGKTYRFHIKESAGHSFVLTTSNVGGPYTTGEAPKITNGYYDLHVTEKTPKFMFYQDGNYESLGGLIVTHKHHHHDC